MQANSVKAIITGGVSGLGFGVAQRIIADGGKVALLDINDDKGAEATKDLGKDAIYFHTDVSDEASVNNSVEQAREFMGGLNCAVNCAGILSAGRVLGREAPMASDYFSAAIKVNLIGSFNIAKAAANIMQNNEPGEDNERGVIINTASVAAFEGQIGQAAYSASKGGVVGMTLPMAREFTRFGVRVMTIAPGIFHTPMVDGMPENVQQALGESIPFPKRLGTSEEFADTCAFILQNRYLNGTVIRLDGGVRLEPK